MSNLSDYMDSARDREFKDLRAQKVADSAWAFDDSGAPILDARAAYELHSIRHAAVTGLRVWLDDSDPLDEEESYSDRLKAHFVGIVDDACQRELTDDDHVVLDIARRAAAIYFDRAGVDEEDITLVLDEWDEAAAERVRDFLVDQMPDGDEETEDEEIDNFVFGEEAGEAMFDATYRRTAAIRGGKKVRIMKRIAGTVHLSAKQRMAVRRASRKSGRAGSRIKRLRSMRIRNARGL